jgi:hypothetical protein
MAKSFQIAVQELPELTPLEQNRIVRPPEAERLSGLDWDTIERNYSHLIIPLSKRAVGMRVGHALQLNKRNKSGP